MDRSPLRGWGAELDERSLVKAYAMMGVFSANHADWHVDMSASAMAEQAARMTQAESGEPVIFDCSRGLHDSRLFAYVRPHELAEAWDAYTRGQAGIRLELRPFGDIYRMDWEPRRFARDLALPECNIGSTFFGVPGAAARQSLHWPIRIGFLSDPRSRELRFEYDRLQSHRTIARLTRAIETSTSTLPVDILVIAESLRGALDRIGHLLYPLRARAVVAMTRELGEWEGTAAARVRISELTGAEAVLEIPATTLSWLHELIVKLSHDDPLDRAFNEVSLGQNWRDASLWSSPEFLRDSRPTQFLRNVVSRARRTLPAGLFVPLHPETGARLGSAPLGDLLNDLEVRVSNIGYFHESDGATIGADLAEAIETISVDPEVREAKVEEPEARYLQTEVFCIDADRRPRQVWDGFVANSKHEVRIAIGPHTLGVITLDDPFNEDLLPPTDDGAHLLVVSFFDPQSMTRPGITSAVLPARGRSAPCHFSFKVAEGAETVEARITVLHENRVIQTGLLVGPVVNMSDMVFRTEPPAEPRIHLALVVSVPPALDFSERPRFDAAFVLNHIKDEAHLLAFRGFNSAPLNLSDTDAYKLRDKFRDLLEQSWHLAKFNGLRAEGTTELLHTLARFGSIFHGIVVEALELDLAGVDKLQVVVARKGERLPLEFIYDLPSPATNAPLCPGAEQALESGKCCGACDGATTLAPYVCPLGFWLFSKVIEWHMFDRELVSVTEGGEFLLEVQERRKAVIDIPGTPLLGYSKKVENVLNSGLAPFSVQGLRDMFPTAKVVDSWTEWKTGIQISHPSVLVLLTHTVPESKTEPLALEMGPPATPVGENDARLPLDRLTDDYIRASKNADRPIVFLLGCKTDDDTEPLAELSAFFQARKAAIVITTNSDMYGQLAGRIAQNCLDHLMRYSGGNESFGDIMLHVRRQLMREGVPMVMCLSAYGDADWKLSASPRN